MDLQRPDNIVVGPFRIKLGNVLWRSVQFEARQSLPDSVGDYRTYSKTHSQPNFTFYQNRPHRHCAPGNFFRYHNYKPYPDTGTY